MGAFWTRFSDKVRAIARRGLPTARNVLYSKLGIWPVKDLSDHWIADIPTYCISLPSATDRRRIVESQVQGMGLRKFTFVDAVIAKTLDRHRLIRDGSYDPKRCLEFHSRELTMNEIACSLSHAAVYRTIVSEGHPWALIVEDDALFNTRQLRRLSFEEIPAGHHLVFLNAFLSEYPPRDRISGRFFKDTSYHGSSAAYLVSLEAAGRLLEEAIPVVHAADGLLGRVLPHPDSESHAFRQRGVSITIEAALAYPELVVNGSTDHYYRSSIRTRRP